jgi:DNA replication protein DnaC
MTMKLLSKSCPDCALAFEVEWFDSPFSIDPDQPVYCDACAEKNFAEWEHQQKLEELKSRYFEAFRKGLVSEAFRDALFSNSDKSVEAINPEAWGMAREWPQLKNLYIYGGVGVGKSFMALCVLRRAFAKGQKVAEVSARRFAKVSDQFREGDGIMDLWKRADWLLLDDIDKARWTLDRIDALWELLDARCSGRRRTIITSNIDPAALRKMLREQTRDGDTMNFTRADATLDRLKPCTTIVMQGRSLRK